MSRPFVDADKIGVIGICAGGGFSISAMKIDPRIKALVTASMVDMGGATRMYRSNEMLQTAFKQRCVEFEGGEIVYTGGTTTELTPETDAMQREFYDFYRTPRGEYTPEGANPLYTTKPTLSSNVKFLNFYPFSDLEVISPRPLLFIAGAEAMSKMFSEQAYQMAGEPKELLLIEGANHVDLYDQVQKIPFAKIESFFRQYLK